LPHCKSLGRCLAPDLIGMGDSEKLPNSGPDRYRFVEHCRYLDAWFEKLGLNSNVTLLVHDWDSALGFDWARRHPQVIKGIAYMEAIVVPFRWDSMPPAVVGAFRSFRSLEGETMVLENNVFVENVIPAAIIRKLGQEEMAGVSPTVCRSGRRSAPNTDFSAANPDRRRTGRRHRVRSGLWCLAE
jgi:haloalkane dehalogenase